MAVRFAGCSFADARGEGLSPRGLAWHTPVLPWPVSPPQLRLHPFRSSINRYRKAPDLAERSSSGLSAGACESRPVSR
jgi:hypothetical protein